MANPNAPSMPPTKPLITELKGACFKMPVPEGWTDRSIYIAALPETIESIQPSVVITQDNVPGLKEFDGYVEGLVLDLKGQLDGFKEVKTERRSLAGRSANYVQYTWKNPKEILLRQAQWYVYKDPVLFIVTASAPESAFARLEPQFDEIVKGFAITLK